MSKNSKKNNNRKNNNINDKILLWAFVFIVIYTIAEFIMRFVGMTLGVESLTDNSLTSEVFSFAKLLLVSGATITVKSKVKNN